jgi:hypothetical protein
MSCCGRTPAAEIRKSIQRRRAWRRACSVWAPDASRNQEAGDDPYRALLRLWLSLGDRFDGRHPSCTAKWSVRRSDKRGVPTH